MPLFNKSKVQSLFISIILSFLLITSLLVYNYFSDDDIKYLLVLVIPLFVFSFLIVYIYLEFYVFKKIKNLYRDLIPENNEEENSLVSTSMDQLIDDLKKFSKESQTEIKSMQEKENFRKRIN